VLIARYVTVNSTGYIHPSSSITARPPKQGFELGLCGLSSDTASAMERLDLLETLPFSATILFASSFLYHGLCCSDGARKQISRRQLHSNKELRTARCHTSITMILLFRVPYVFAKYRFDLLAILINPYATILSSSGFFSWIYRHDGLDQNRGQLFLTVCSFPCCHFSIAINLHVNMISLDDQRLFRCIP